MEYLDKQMQQWSTQLREKLEIMPPESDRLASVIAAEVGALSDVAKQRVRKASLIPLSARIEELSAF